MHVSRFTEQADFIAAHEAPVVHERNAVQLQIAKQNRWKPRFAVPGFCKMCNQAVDFKVDRKYGPSKVEGVWMPNWRERMVCPLCKLVNRQRALGWLVGETFGKVVAEHAVRPLQAYMMEQLTDFFANCAGRHAEAQWTGSEYLGPDVAPGEVRDRVRHENAEQLSFEDASLHLVVSSDVFEHVPHPEVAIREVVRVLVPGGRFVLSVPFNGWVEHNTVRASLDDAGTVVHHEVPEYHHNPIDAKGSLVFTAFGWQLVDQLREAGFEDVEVVSYWSHTYGHLGDPQPLFTARRP